MKRWLHATTHRLLKLEKETLFREWCLFRAIQSGDIICSRSLLPYGWGDRYEGKYCEYFGPIGRGTSCAEEVLFLLISNLVGLSLAHHWKIMMISTADHHVLLQETRSTMRIFNFIIIFVLFK